MINPHKLLKFVDIELIPNKSGIYFFFNKNLEISYIGKSNNLKSRIKQHSSYGDKLYNVNFISYIICEREDLNNMEYEYINNYSPQYNNIGNIKTLYMNAEIERKMRGY